MVVFHAVVHLAMYLNVKVVVINCGGTVANVYKVVVIKCGGTVVNVLKVVVFHVLVRLAMLIVTKCGGKVVTGQCISSGVAASVPTLQITMYPIGNVSKLVISVVV